MNISVPIRDFVQDAGDLKLMRELFERVTGGLCSIELRAEATRIIIDDDLICTNKYVKPFLIISIDYEHKDRG